MAGAFTHANCRNTVTANQGSSRAMTGSQASSAAGALVNGIGAAAKKAGKAANNRRRLLQEAGTGLTAAEAFISLTSGAASLCSTQAASALLGGEVTAAGDAGVCVAPALQTSDTMAGLSWSLGCSGIAASAQVCKGVRLACVLEVACSPLGQHLFHYLTVSC